jgi:hypothetical protein
MNEHPEDQTESAGSVTSILGSNLNGVAMARETRHSVSAFSRRFKSTLAILGAGDLQRGVDHNFAKAIAGLGLAHRAASLYMQILEVELIPRDAP